MVSSSTDLTGAKAVVFGGCGFLGLRIAERLACAGAETVIFDAAPCADLVPTGASYQQGDALDGSAVSRALKGAQRVFAFAGAGGAPASLADPVGDFTATCQAQLVLLEAVRSTCPEATVVFPGSRLEYGRPQGLPVDETHPVAGESPYAIHKSACAAYYRVYAHIHGLRTIILRFSNPYGPHRPHEGYKGFGILNHFVDLAVLGRPIRLYGDGSQMRDFVYVDDVVDAALAASGRPDLAGETMNVGAGQGVSLRQTAEQISDIAGGVSIEYVPWPDDLLRLETGDFYFDIRRAAELLGWRPRTTLREGLEATLAACGQQGV